MKIKFLDFVSEVEDFAKDKKVIFIQKIQPIGFMIVYKEKLLSKILKTIFHSKNH